MSYTQQLNILVILPSVSYSYDQSINGVKVKHIQELKYQFEKRNINWKIGTYLGNQPIINFEKDEKNKKWILDYLNKDYLADILNTNNLSASGFDGLVIPNSISIYEELKVSTNNLPKLILGFHNANKPICVIGHSVYALCKVLNEGSTWPFVGYNFSGTSIAKFMDDNLFSNKTIEGAVEELVTLQGGNFVCTDKVSDDIVCVCDRNIITGQDDYSFPICLNNLIFKLNA